MKTITRTFAHDRERYYYDFEACNTASGWAQIDTSQDASYYGNWANPFTLETVCFCEGDIIHVQLGTPDEFTQELREMAAWNAASGHVFRGIDPGFNADLKAAFVSLGLTDLLH